MIQKMNITTRPMKDSDFELSFEIKKKALGPYITKRWGWDDTVQRRFHREHWNKRELIAIQLDGIDIGTLWIKKFNDHWRFGEFFILPQYQNRGVGSHILSKVITDADQTHLPIRLEYLKWNPVASLYERNGFHCIGENETHYFMERNEPKPAY